MLRARSVLGLMSGVVASFALVGCSGSAACGDTRSCEVADASAPDALAEAAPPRVDAGVDAPTVVSSDASADARVDAGEHEAGTADASVSTDAASVTADAQSEDVKVDTFVCDPTEPPSAGACVLEDGIGVFVALASNGGSDTVGNGSSASPYATLSHALASLGAASRVYVCNGAYTDQVTVTSAVTIFGGLSCGAPAATGSVGPWAYVAGTKATLRGASPAFVLQVNAGSAVVDIEDLEIDAAPGTIASPSSIAVFATSSTAVTLRRTTLVAAPGFEGASGSAGAAGTVASATAGTTPIVPASLAGQRAVVAVPGAATTCVCAAGDMTVGGAGGDGAVLAGQGGLPGQTTPTPALATGAGSTESQCMGGIAPSAGSDAIPSTAEAGVSAELVGVLDVMGWHPGSGGLGVNGAAAQGGGGAGMALQIRGPSFAGGGGGCGGCGGLGGGAGAGGGGSIALLAFDSPVQLVSATVSTSAGGAGGSGAGGGAGGAGGAGGGGNMCSGAAGGKGARGGPGGGGAGGVSIGILYTGVAPVTDVATQVLPGTAGVGGVGGDPGVNDGVVGVSGSVENVTAL
jgi:hypothetical protein